MVHDHMSSECCRQDQARPDPACCGGSNAKADDARNPPGGQRSEAYRLVFAVRGLDCAEEVAVLKREIGPMVGGADHLAFDVLNGRMMVLRDATAVSAERIRQAVARTGMAAEEWRPEAPAGDLEGERHRRVQALLTAASGLFLALGLGLELWLDESFTGELGFGAPAAHSVPLPAMLAYGLAIICGGRYVVVKAWHAARRLRPDMNLLMTIAVIGAIAIGAWPEAAAVAFLFALSLALEGWSVGRARRAVAALLDLAPSIARLKLETGAEREVPAAEVVVGSRIVVHPGERIPLDGRVAAGESDVDQAPITGESRPVSKGPEAEIFAGTINGDGALEIVTTKPASDTVLSQIIRMVGEAHSRRARAEQWVDRFAAVYTPAVVALAAAVALLPPITFGAAWAPWFYNALVLLVIACPCALVISTPVSIVAGLASAARNGVLVKGGIYLEAPARLKAIAFDKTGTLTEGRPVVVGLEPLNSHTEEELLARAAALEMRSEHPLAKAIVAYARERQVEPVPADDVRALSGKGVSGIVAGRRFWLGSHRILEEVGRATEETEARAKTIERAGRTVVLVGTEEHVCGLLALADAVRPQSVAALRELRASGVTHLVMLTGDNRATAESIAREAGVDEVHAELLPAEKVTAVEALVHQYGTVGMVGDGVNDAPAMARADLGIAMGAIGSDAAIETADVALMTDDLAKLPWLVRHSRRTLAVIRTNIVFALAVKAVFAGLAVVGLATLWGAIAADVGAALLVVANALRLLRVERLDRARTYDSAQATDAIVAAKLTHGH